MEKKCNTCAETKPSTEFNRSKATLDGFQYMCKACCKEYNRRRYEANPKKYTDYTKSWMKRNPEKTKANKKNARRSTYARKRENYSWAVRNIMANGSTKYCCPHIGCTGADLRRHIESKFRFGMTWGNYRTLWTLDHIKPVSLWPIERMREADHYTNLQPLLKADNDEKQKAPDAAPCLVCELYYAPRQLELGICRNCR